jgi:isochorismate synthase
MMQIKGASFIERCLAQKIPFLGCMRPNSTQVEWYTLGKMTFDQSQLAINKGSEVFVVQPYDRAQNAIHFSLTPITGAVIDQLDDAQLESSAAEYVISADQAEAYDRMLQKAVARINEGELDKVVLSMRLALANLSKVNLNIRNLFTPDAKDSFRYIFSLNEGVVWVGDTPETLLTRHHSRIQTVALAGTRRLDDVKHDDFTSKEFEEQGFIVAELQQRLASFVERVQLSDRQPVSAQNLVHLKTTLEGTLKEDFSDEELLAALHPTAAVCGFPREKALVLISTLEGHDRELYAGYMGFRSAAKSTYFVNLRCARIDQSALELFVGAGITAQSVSKKEIDEIQSKTATIMRLIAFK